MADNDKTPDEKKKSLKVSVAKTSPKLEELIREIEKLSVMELADLVKALENKFGVSAMPAMAPAAVPTAESKESGKEGAPSGQTTFNVVLASAGDNKISAIKAVREINQDLGLKEAKDLVESAPKEVLSAANKEIAEEAKKKLERAGAQVELK